MSRRVRRIWKAAIWVTLAVVLFIIVRLALTPIETKIAYETWSREGVICLHGLVVDANGHPVSGAEVEVNVHHFRMLSFLYGPLSDSYKRTLVTDENGRFVIAGVPGMNLYITRVTFSDLQLLYDQYSADFENVSYRFANLDLKGYTLDSYRCDPDRPAVFPMIRPGDTPAVWPSRGGEYVDSTGRIVETGLPRKPERPSIRFTDPRKGTAGGN
jgi:hypothetical protein